MEFQPAEQDGHGGRRSKRATPTVAAAVTMDEASRPRRTQPAMDAAEDEDGGDGGRRRRGLEEQRKRRTETKALDAGVRMKIATGGSHASSGGATVHA
uniref:Uncharacterized protein n=1 Tax=Leersia perrieri TaxID=77586 RepID=A0A0D9V429_9ORYZ